MVTKILKIVFVIIIVALLVVVGVGYNTDIAPRYFDRDYEFAFDKSRMTIIYYDIVGIAISDNSYIKVGQDGTVDIYIELNEGIKDVIELLNVDLSSLSQMDINKEITDVYGKQMFPNFSTDDVHGTFATIKDILGLEFVVNKEEVSVKKLIESIEKTGHINEDFSIPSKVGIRYQGNYVRKELKSEVTQKEYTAIYLDKYSEGGEPFFIITMKDSEKKEGKKELDIICEFLQCRVSAIEK